MGGSFPDRSAALVRKHWGSGRGRPPTFACLLWKWLSSSRHWRSLVRQERYSSLRASSSERSSVHCKQSEGPLAGGIPSLFYAPRAAGLPQRLQRFARARALPFTAATRVPRYTYRGQSRPQRYWECGERGNAWLVTLP